METTTGFRVYARNGGAPRDIWDSEKIILKMEEILQGIYRDYKEIVWVLTSGSRGICLRHISFASSSWCLRAVEMTMEATVGFAGISSSKRVGIWKWIPITTPMYSAGCQTPAFSAPRIMIPPLR